MDFPFTVALSAQFFSIAVGIYSYRKKSVSVSGLIALLIISSLFIWLDMIALLFVLFFMFTSSSILSRYRKHEKKAFDRVVAKTGPRDYIQALCNLGVATFLGLLYYWTQEEVYIVALTASVSAGNADSWASEIGGLSKKQPLLVTSFKPVPKGISGGVTLTGTLGGVAGSLFITAASIGTMQIIDPFEGNLPLFFWSAFLAGIFGLIFDSYLGALLQSLYIDKNNQLTENPHEHIQRIKGFEWMNNDMVNLLSTLAGAIVGGIIYILFN